MHEAILVKASRRVRVPCASSGPSRESGSGGNESRRSPARVVSEVWVMPGPTSNASPGGGGGFHANGCAGETNCKERERSLGGGITLTRWRNPFYNHL